MWSLAFVSALLLCSTCAVPLDIVEGPAADAPVKTTVGTPTIRSEVINAALQNQTQVSNATADDKGQVPATQAPKVETTTAITTAAAPGINLPPEVHDITTTEPPTTTTTKPTTPTTTTTPSTTTTTVKPSTTSSTETPTPKPTPSTTSTTVSPSPTNATTAKPTGAPSPTPPSSHERKFDGPSFIGGIILACGLTAIGFIAFKFYKARTEHNYHTL